MRFTRSFIVTAIGIIVCLVLIYIINKTETGTTLSIRSFPEPATQLAQVAGSGGSCSAVCSGLVLYWPLDDGSGTIASDASGNSNNGTLSPASNPPTWTAGAVGSGALSFNGATSFVSLAALNSFTLNKSSTYSVSFWFNAAALTSGSVVEEAGGYSRCEIGYDPTAMLSCTVNGGSSEVYSVSTLNKNAWYQAAYVVTPSSQTLYLDGSQQSTSAAGPLTPADDSFHLGKDIFSGDYFNGSIDDVRVYNRALSSQEVSQLYSLGGASAQPVAAPAQPAAPTQSTQTATPSTSGSSSQTSAAQTSPVQQQPTSPVTTSGQIYIAQSLQGSGDGSSCANALPVTWFNTASSWGSVPGEIGPGDTVHLCGTFTSSAHNGNALTVQGSGAPGNPITILFEPGAKMISTGWWGNYNNDACASCTGAITVNNQNYITIDGGTNGVIENSLAGCTSNCLGGQPAICPAGSCTQSPNTSGSLGVHLDGDDLIVRDLTIGPLYMNTGSDSSVNDAAGLYTADIRVDGRPTTLQIYNNTLISARSGIFGNFAGTTGPNSCPSSGVCIYDNTVSDHDWSMTLNSGVPGATVNVYGNNIGDAGNLTGWLNWQFPVNSYHQDGIFIWSAVSGSALTAYVYDNYIHGYLGAGSPSGLIYCANNESAGTGCALTAFNNLIVGRGDQIIAVKLDDIGSLMGPVRLYNNTFIGGAFQVELYNEVGGPTFGLSAINNIFYPGSNSSRFYDQENGGQPYGSVNNSNNDYYESPAPFDNLAWNGEPSLTAWQARWNSDANSTTSNPLLDGNYFPTSASPILMAGTNLSSLGIEALNTDKNGNARPANGTWDIGAYQYSSAGAAASQETVTQPPAIVNSATPSVPQTPSPNAPQTPVTPVIPVTPITPVATIPAVPNIPTAPPAIPAIPLPPAETPAFTRTLSVGSTGTDVKTLQIFLNTHGFPIAEQGLGSPGNESTSFGPATMASLARFQTYYGVGVGAGLFTGSGSLDTPTLQLINDLSPAQ